MKIFCFLSFFLLLFCGEGQTQDDPCKYIPVALESSKDTCTQLPSKKKFQFKRENEFYFLFTPSSEETIYKAHLSSRTNLSYTRIYQQYDMTFSLFDETSFELVSDSTLQKQSDFSRLKISVKSSVENSRKWKKSSSILLQTQKLPEKNSLTTQSSLNVQNWESTFLSPGLIVLNVGFTKEWDSNNSIECGIAGGKVKWIDKKELYEINKVEVLSGVPREKPFLLEGGFTLQASFKKNFNNSMHWENTTLLFADIEDVNHPDVELRNGIFWNIGKTVRTSIRTIYSYDRKRMQKAIWKGELSLGFIFSGL